MRLSEEVWYNHKCKVLFRISNNYRDIGPSIVQNSTMADFHNNVLIFALFSPHSNSISIVYYNLIEKLIMFSYLYYRKTVKNT